MPEPRPIAILTGLGRPVGIAAGIAVALAEAGWDLAVTAWSPADEEVFGGGAADGIDVVLQQVERAGATVVSVPVDLADPQSPSQLVSTVVDQLGAPSALVLSHAWSVDSGILDTSVEQFDRHFAVNARASWLLIAEFARVVSPGGGAIVALTSDHTVGNLPYGMSKGALDRLVIAAGKELAHLGISSNVVNPGPIDTGWMTPELRDHFASLQPSGRLGTPEDTANLVAFLVSPRGRWINGQLLKSDGGISIHG